MIEDRIFDTLRDRIERLKEYRDEAYRISDAVSAIENEIASLDESLPNPSKLSEIKDRDERLRLRKAEDLLKEAYALIDELLGPPDMGEVIDETPAYIPQARGNEAASLQEMLDKFPIGGKGNTRS